MLNLHQKYCMETFYDGRLVNFEPVYKDNFNFAYDVVDKIAEVEPNRRAMLWCNDKGEERTFTFADIKKYSNMTANMLRANGIRKGDKVMLILKRHYQFWFCVMALHKLGAVAVPASNLLTKNDIIYRFEKANIKAIVCTVESEVIDHVESALNELNEAKVKFCVRGKRNGFICFDEEIEKYSDELKRVKTHSDEPILSYFTSGTTGHPKVVTHCHTYPLGHIITAKYWQSVDPDGLHLTISDTGWMKCMWGKLYGQWFMEAGIFVYDFDKFKSNEILPLFKKYQITTFCAPPTMYRFFIREDLSKYDLSSLKHAAIAGEALNPEVYNKFVEATGVKLMEAFGQSETTPLLLNLQGTEPKPGSMGTVSPGYDVDLVDPDGNSVDEGIVGEIVVRTDKYIPCGLFVGYTGDDDKTNSSWYDDVYHTGDTAWKDEDGYFWYVGRTDDIIKSSGYRIGPFEIESVIMELPYVLECAITGVPDPIRGQVIKATIVLTKDKQASEELKKEIQVYVKDQTAPYKYPRIVEFVNELPKTTSGKIRRNKIRKDHK
ncbi:MAG: AMP-binding protein [Clostridia bacterium]|nr:AMP-binding protein [Clostridia bacterium]